MLSLSEETARVKYLIDETEQDINKTEAHGLLIVEPTHLRQIVSSQEESLKKLKKSIIINPIQAPSKLSLC